MKKALYIGIFDPITLSHLDIIERSKELVDELVIGVVVDTPVRTEIDLDDRIQLVKKAVQHLKDVKVVECTGSVSDMVEKYQVDLMIRGLRMMTDFENELNLVHANTNQKNGIDTVFLSTNEAYSNFSSKEVRQIAKNHGMIEPFLPTCIIDDVKSIYA